MSENFFTELLFLSKSHEKFETLALKNQGSQSKSQSHKRSLQSLSLSLVHAAYQSQYPSRVRGLKKSQSRLEIPSLVCLCFGRLRDTKPLKSYLLADTRRKLIGPTSSRHSFWFYLPNWNSGYIGSKLVVWGRKMTDKMWKYSNCIG